MRSIAVLAALSLVLACSRGGGGGGTPGPALAKAAFVGSGSTPAAGDALVLLFTQDIATTGALLDDADVVLPPGASLGAVQAAPTQLSARSVRVVLGAGVSFSPGPNGTPIACSTDNDALRGSNGAPPEAGVAQPITIGDGDNPTIDLLTLNAVPAVLNGEGPAGGRMQVPPAGFTIDLEHSDASSAVEPTATLLTANVPVGAAPPGTDLTGLLQATLSPAASSYLVPASAPFPLGPVTLTAVVVDTTGMGSAPKSFTFTVQAASNAIRPLESGQTWYLDFDRDLESYEHDLGSTTVSVKVVAGPNNVSDLEDVLAIVGLQGSDASVNATVMGQIKDEMMDRLAELYGGTSVSFTLTAPGTFPQSASPIPYGAFSFSQMCIAGAADEDGTSGTLGLAIFDPNNETQDDDCDPDFSGSRLGVFLHTMVNFGLLSPSATQFRLTYDPFTPGFGGTPVGAADAPRLAGTLQDPRATQLAIAISRTARTIALIAAHECGHSMGLVQDGAMPVGLYGGDPVNFPGSTGGHINNEALFPGAAQNVMSPGISFEGAVNPGSAFNQLNIAYLRERALYNN